LQSCGSYELLGWYLEEWRDEQGTLPHIGQLLSVKLRQMQTSSAVQTTHFQQQMREMQDENEQQVRGLRDALTESSRSTSHGGSGGVGGKLGNLAAAAGLAVVDPWVGIPLAAMSLVDLINDL
jgi:hypothetical protein